MFIQKHASDTVFYRSISKKLLRKTNAKIVWFTPLCNNSYFLVVAFFHCTNEVRPVFTKNLLMFIQAHASDTVFYSSTSRDFLRKTNAWFTPLQNNSYFLVFVLDTILSFCCICISVLFCL